MNYSISTYIILFEKLVTNWAWYRKEDGKFVPEDIDPELCTHVIYAFAVIDPQTNTIKMHDSWADKDNKFYEKVTALKKKGVKVWILNIVLEN